MVMPVNIDALEQNIDQNKLPHDIQRYSRERAKEIDRLFTESCMYAIEKQQNFAYECNLRIDQLKNVRLFDEAGYKLRLIYIWLDNVDISTMRVKKRVLQGGHSVGIESIVENYYSGMKNLDDSFYDWHEVYVFDNSMDISDDAEFPGIPLLLYKDETGINYVSNLLYKKENIRVKLPSIFRNLPLK